ncbi:MAG: hypothetical protein HXX08_06755 [Chloroflexi bacterium]|uniref:Uncharacterized protein n=1 Tax=Candidatus Chlorohelix allophototropha TaxID=3003348 RepID=A0A8T7M0W3_9CHLR|nr:hypothetical protein [Chloroflexota bacterium]WJW67433.1 hypothetical protein OZ401_000699 [Chloroflexota bacterium L227-S17]
MAENEELKPNITAGQDANKNIKPVSSPAFASNASFSIARRFGYYDALSSRWLNIPPTARMGNSIVARYSVFPLPFDALGRGLLSVRQRKTAPLAQVQRNVSNLSPAKPTSYNLAEAQPEYEFEEFGYENVQSDFDDTIIASDPEPRQNSISSASSIARIREFQTPVQRSLEGLARSRDWRGMAGQDASELEGAVFNSSDSYYLDMVQASRSGTPVQEESFVSPSTSFSDSGFRTSSLPIQPILVSSATSSLQRFVAPETSVSSTESRPTEVPSPATPIQKPTHTENESLSGYSEPLPTSPNQESGSSTPIIASGETAVPSIQVAQGVSEITQTSALQNIVSSPSETGGQLNSRVSSESLARAYTNEERPSYSSESTLAPMVFPRARRVNPATHQNSLSSPKVMRQLSELAASREWGNTLEFGEAQGIPPIIEGGAYTPPEMVQRNASSPTQTTQADSTAATSINRSLASGSDSNITSATNRLTTNPVTSTEYSQNPILQTNLGISSSLDSKQESATTSAFQPQPSQISRSIENNNLTQNDNAVSRVSASISSQLPENFPEAKELEAIKEVAQEPETTTATLTTALQGQSAIARAIQRAEEVVADEENDVDRSYPQSVSTIESPPMVFRSLATGNPLTVTSNENGESIAPENRLTTKAQSNISDNRAPALNEFEESNAYAQSPSTLPVGAQAIRRFTEERANIAAWAENLPQTINAGFETPSQSVAETYGASPSINRVFAAQDKTGNVIDENATAVTSMKNNPSEVAHTVMPVQGLMSSTNSIQRIADLASNREWGNAFDFEGFNIADSRQSTKSPDMVYPTITPNLATSSVQRTVAATVAPSSNIVGNPLVASTLRESGISPIGSSTTPATYPTPSGQHFESIAPDQGFFGTSISRAIERAKQPNQDTVVEKSTSDLTFTTPTFQPIRESGIPHTVGSTIPVTTHTPPGVSAISGLEFSQTSISRAMERTAQADEWVAATIGTPDLNFSIPPLIMRKVGDFTPTRQDFTTNDRPDFAESVQAYTPGALPIALSFEVASSANASSSIMRSLPETDSSYDIGQVYLTDIASTKDIPQQTLFENRSRADVPSSTNMSHLSSVQPPTSQTSTSVGEGRKVQPESLQIGSGFTNGSGLFRSTLLPASSSIDNTSQPAGIERMIMRHLNVAATSTESASAEEDVLNYPARNVVDQHADIERTVLRHISLANASQASGTHSEWAYPSSEPVHLRPEPVMRGAETAVVSSGIQRFTDGISSESNFSQNSSQLSGNSQPQAEVDIEKITTEVYRKLKRDMQIERERLGLRSGLMR